MRMANRTSLFPREPGASDEAGETGEGVRRGGVIRGGSVIVFALFDKSREFPQIGIDFLIGEGVRGGGAGFGEGGWHLGEAEVGAGVACEKMGFVAFAPDSAGGFEGLVDGLVELAVELLGEHEAIVGDDSLREGGIYLGSEQRGVGLGERWDDKALAHGVVARRFGGRGVAGIDALLQFEALALDGLEFLHAGETLLLGEVGFDLREFLAVLGDFGAGFGGPGFGGLGEAVEGLEHATGSALEIGIAVALGDFDKAIDSAIVELGGFRLAFDGKIEVLAVDGESGGALLLAFEGHLAGVFGDPQVERLGDLGVLLGSVDRGATKGVNGLAFVGLPDFAVALGLAVDAWQGGGVGGDVVGEASHVGAAAAVHALEAFVGGAEFAENLVHLDGADHVGVALGMGGHLGHVHADLVARVFELIANGVGGEHLGNHALFGGHHGIDGGVEGLLHAILDDLDVELTGCGVGGGFDGAVLVVFGQPCFGGGGTFRGRERLAFVVLGGEAGLAETFHDIDERDVTPFGVQVALADDAPVALLHHGRLKVTRRHEVMHGGETFLDVHADAEAAGGADDDADVAIVDLVEDVGEGLVLLVGDDHDLTLGHAGGDEFSLDVFAEVEVATGRAAIVAKFGILADGVLAEVGKGVIRESLQNVHVEGIEKVREKDLGGFALGAGFVDPKHFTNRGVDLAVGIVWSFIVDEARIERRGDAGLHGHDRHSGQFGVCLDVLPRDAFP